MDSHKTAFRSDLADMSQHRGSGPRDKFIAGLGALSSRDSKEPFECDTNYLIPLLQLLSSYDNDYPNLSPLVEQAKLEIQHARGYVDAIRDTRNAMADKCEQIALSWQGIVEALSVYF